MLIENDKFQIIPSVREIKHLEFALSQELDYILLSGAHIGNLKSLVELCHGKGKKVIVNPELIGGLGSDKIAFQMLKSLYNVDIAIGVRESRLNMIKSAGLSVIQRVTIMDSLSLDLGMKTLEDSKCDAVELRPGIYALKYIKYFKQVYKGPYYLGGFVNNQEILKNAYDAGFKGVTTSTRELWSIKL